MTTDNIRKPSDKNYIEIIGILIKAKLIFWIIRRLTTDIRLIDGILGQLLHTALFILVIYTYIRQSVKKQGITLEECRITKFRCSKQDILRAIGIPLIISLGVLIVAGGMRPTEVDLNDLAYFSLSNFIWSSIASGVTEELFYRGYVFKSVETKSDWKSAVFFSSVLFGLGHIGGSITTMHAVSSFLGSASLGVLFAVMTYKHGTIWPSVLVHMVMNSKERLLGFYESSSLFVFDFENTPMEIQLIIAWIVCSIVSAITIWVYLQKSRKAETHC